MTEERRYTRREFVVSAGMATSLAAAAAMAASFGWRFIYPAAAQIPTVQVLAMPLSKLPPGSRKTVQLVGNEVVLANQDGKIHAFSTVCTHLGCKVSWNDSRQAFICPCHNGIFDASGKVVAGPPPRPLDEFAVEIKAGNIYVSVPQKEGST